MDNPQKSVTGDGFHVRVGEAFASSPPSPPAKPPGMPSQGAGGQDERGSSRQRQAARHCAQLAIVELVRER